MLWVYQVEHPKNIEPQGFLAFSDLSPKRRKFEARDDASENFFAVVHTFYLGKVRDVADPTSPANGPRPESRKATFCDSGRAELLCRHR